jgi:hypothetical protein
MISPLTVRLDVDQQKMVDGMWNNMLTPTDRLDRELLLDVLCQSWLFQIGVDRLHLTSEKAYDRGRVVMEIDCDRANPTADQLTVTLLDDRGRTVRRERYTRPEIDERVALLQNAPTTRPATSEENEIRQSERERRLERIQAATQPAR